VCVCCANVAVLQVPVWVGGVGGWVRAFGRFFLISTCLCVIK